MSPFTRTNADSKTPICASFTWKSSWIWLITPRTMFWSIWSTMITIPSTHMGQLEMCGSSVAPRRLTSPPVSQRPRPGARRSSRPGDVSEPHHRDDLGTEGRLHASDQDCGDRMRGRALHLRGGVQLEREERERNDLAHDRRGAVAGISRHTVSVQWIHRLAE